MQNVGQCNSASCNYFYSQYHERHFTTPGRLFTIQLQKPIEIQSRLLAKRFQIYSNIMQYGKRLCGMSQETKIPTPYCKTPEPQSRTIFWFLQETVQLRKDKYLCCCCCKSGPLTCALRLDRTGYVPGEDINLDAEIQNMSRKDITASYVTMQQVQTS